MMDKLKAALRCLESSYTQDVIDEMAMDYLCDQMDEEEVFSISRNGGCLEYIKDMLGEDDFIQWIYEWFEL